ncbi:DMT family transporter [Flavobacterium kingsejongi]|uniref:Transporter n=1 Tax=Flavobacterium kingsejongi TaxID=1678728 RepID=A0A2S1LPH7_9FLAO|nr:DMT family transporter [Flavobacterium kingsejongi]AWG25644.1 transporter [Flavobacterium kingsejongi]
MIYIFLSILCSVSVGVLLKIAKKYTIDIVQVITCNYVIALLLSYISFRPDLSVVTSEAPWAWYIALGILLPSVFLFLAASIRHMGIVKTDIAQRLSLFIPILASYFIFHETIAELKLTGLAIGFLAVFFTLYKSTTTGTTSQKWLYTAVVLLGFGTIDILFKQIAAYTPIAYTTSLFVVFVCALVMALLFTLYEFVAQKSTFNKKNIAVGVLLGALNFGNILFYLKAHKAFSSNPSTVFASMNLGVVVLGSLIGIFAFHEKMNRINYAGILMAIAAIILITLSQLNYSYADLTAYIATLF